MAESLDYPAIETEAPAPGIMVAGRFAQSQGYHVYRSKGTRDWLMALTLSGEGRFRYKEKERICSAYDIAILAPGTQHDYATLADEPWKFHWVHFVPEPGWIAYLHQLPEVWAGFYHCYIDDPRIFQRVAQAMERLIDDSRDPYLHYERLALNALEEILLLLAGKYGVQHKRTLDPRVKEVLRILSVRMHEKHSVDRLACEVNLSPSRLAHLFKEETGDSIIETLIKIRLRQAARLLQFTASTIGDIAADVGFNDPYYFTKQFRTIYGMSPTVFRKQRQKQTP